MTQEIIDKLTKEKADLQKQIDGLNEGVKGLIAQLDATKQMFNEASNSSLQLRTGNILFQNQIKELSQKNDDLVKQLITSKAPQEPVPIAKGK